MNASDHFGRKLRKLRQSSGLTAKDLGESLNCSASLIYGLEKGRNKPQPELIVNTSRLFGVTTDYLLKDSGLPSEEEFVDQYRRLDSKTKSLVFQIINFLKLFSKR